MREKSIVEAEWNELLRQISNLEAKRRGLRAELDAIKLEKAKTQPWFPVGTVLIRFDRLRKKTHRVIYQGPRQGAYGIEECGINIKKDGSQGAAVKLWKGDGWKPENA